LTESANLNEVTLFDLFKPFSFYKRVHPGPSFPSLTYLFLFQIGEFDLVQEARPIVDDDLLEAVTLTAKSCSVTGHLSIGKDIDIVR